ncbi:unnamed protein product [Lymnaea stagnalis]|uniref:Uncharacterized protein n=1 Tax=Lymnaea stagnalis TaxID=6523 RepID=A0AAV2IMX5_LYMST
MSTIQFTFAVFLLMTCSSRVHSQICEAGWFGSKCQFQCHCTSPCHSITGQCQGKSTCLKGWFGNACQYRDLAHVSSCNIVLNPRQPFSSWVTDRNDSTCNEDVTLESVALSWSTSVPFTWMRLTLNESVILRSLRVSFTSKTSSNATCIDTKLYLINNKTVDIRCKVIVDTTSVIIEGQGVKSLCSLYINGGRNVALKQNSAQTSTYTSPTVAASASKAVDGNTLGLLSSNTCMRTQSSDTCPNWNVTFDQSQVLTAIHIYNTNDAFPVCSGRCGLQLNKFSLESFNSSGTVFRYQDHSTTFTSLYEVTVAEMASGIPVNGLRLGLNRTNPILMMCEVEAYGECVPGSWGLECKKICADRCSSQCHVETGSCPVCNDFDDRSSCHTGCATGYFGYDCSQPCSQNCQNRECNSTTGLCFSCVDGYLGPDCPENVTENIEDHLLILITGLGVGLGVSCAVIASLLIVIIYLIGRGKQPLKESKPSPDYIQRDSIGTGTMDSHGYQIYVTPVRPYQNVSNTYIKVIGDAEVIQPPDTYINVTTKANDEHDDC